VQLADPFYDLEGQIAIDLPGTSAVFTTRSWGDARDALPTIGARLGVQPVRALQVHGTAVVATATVAADTEADALFATTPGVAPTVITADCVPIAIAAAGIVAAIHAGWRGLADGVISKALAELRARQDGTSANAFSAAIGPAAGACCYEVGPELHARFPGFSRQRNLDLRAIARAQLQDAGIKTIHDCGICTICSTDPELFSYRRQGEAAGRQALIAWLT
jgi:polyphenol oxidase